MRDQGGREGRPARAEQNSVYITVCGPGRFVLHADIAREKYVVGPLLDSEYPQQHC